MFRRPLVAILALGLGVVGVPALSTAATAAATGTPVVLDVPAGNRFEPRTTLVVGETTTQGVLIRQEADPVGTSEIGQLSDSLIAPGGSTPVDGNPQDVLGDRLVDRPGTASVTSTVLPGGQPATLDIPSGFSLLDYTGDGLVLSTGASGSESLWLLPWGGGDPVAIAGVPDGYDLDANYDYVHDATGTVLRIYSHATSTGGRLVVDTSLRQAWQLSPASDANCDPATGTTWAMNDGVVAWQSNGSTGPRVICTAPRPAAATDPAPATDHRTAVDMPVQNSWGDVSLLPTGDDVVVSVDWAARAQDAAPVYDVHADGTKDTLLAWGHDVVPGGSGQVLAVGGPTAHEADLLRITVGTTSSQTTVAAISPVPATTSSLAVDDGRLVAMDNSGAGYAVVERSLSFDGGGQVGAAKQVDDNPVTDRVVAGGGETSWEKNGAWALRDSTGAVTSSYLPDKGSVPRGVRAVSGRWVLYTTSYRPPQVLDTEQNSLATIDGASEYADPDLVDGVLYVQGASVSSALADRVVMRDLATGQAASMHVPGCAAADDVQAAGSWLLVLCGSGYVVVDRTGGTTSYALAKNVPVTLGNGFAVRRNADGSLDWWPLTDPNASWQPLAGPGEAAQVAVGKGSEPSVAWSDGHTTRVALLPVDASANPARPTGVSKPAAPQVTLTPYDKTIAVRWAPAATSEQITGYIVSGSGYARYLGPDQTSTVYTGLSNGSSYNLTVTAVNIAGRSATTQSATPLAPPAAPTNVQATVDPVTSKVHVTWDWSPSAKSESLVSFDAGAGQPLVTGLSPDARSATFVMPTAWTGPVTVTARGAVQQADGNSAPLTFPGLDTQAPTSSVGGIPAVLLRRSLSVAVRGADDRALGSVDVRWRSAGFGQRLGTWSRPATWQGVQPGRLTVGGLNAGSTYCFSSRAHDEAGNTSRWTAAKCTSVALDDRSLTRVGHWANVSGSGYYRSTASRTTAHDAALTRGSVHAASVWLVATTCPTCGTVTVFSGQTSFGKTSLRSPVRHDHRLIKVSWPMKTGGTLKIATWPRWGRVTIDAVAVRDY